MIYSKTEETQPSINLDEDSRNRDTRDVPNLSFPMMMRSRWRLPGAHSPPEKRTLIFNSKLGDSSLRKSIVPDTLLNTK